MSAKCSDRQTEDTKIKEYLQRSDTAVIFAEPVETVETKFIDNNENEKDGQSVRAEDNDKNVVNTNENGIPESRSSNQSKSDFCFDGLQEVSKRSQLLFCCLYSGKRQKRDSYLTMNRT